MQLKPCYLFPIHFSIAVGDSPEDYFILSWIIKQHLFHETLPGISLLILSEFPTAIHLVYLMAFSYSALFVMSGTQ